MTIPLPHPTPSRSPTAGFGVCSWAVLCSGAPLCLEASGQQPWSLPVRDNTSKLTLLSRRPTDVHWLVSQKATVIINKHFLRLEQILGYGGQTRGVQYISNTADVIKHGSKGGI